MEVHFTPEQETQLYQFAAYEGTDAERLVKDYPRYRYHETVQEPACKPR